MENGDLPGRRKGYIVDSNKINRPYLEYNSLTRYITKTFIHAQKAITQSVVREV